MGEKIQSFIIEIIPWLSLHGLKILFMLAGGYVVKHVAQRFIVKVVRISVKRDETRTANDEKKREDTLIRIFVLGSDYTIIAIVMMMILQEAGIPIGPMLAGAGMVGIALGFGGQFLVRDLITGFFVIMENQYGIGDVVSFDGTSGKVEDISLRVTTLRDLDGTLHHIPHGEIKRVSNYSKSFASVNLNIPVPYSANLNQVIEIINKVGDELSNDPVWKDQILTPIRFLRVEDFSDTSILLKIFGDTQPLKQWQVTGELRKRIKEAFDKENIEMPSHPKFFRSSNSPDK